MHEGHLYDFLMANDDLASHGFGMSRSLNETQIGSTSWICRLCPTAILCDVLWD